MRIEVSTARDIPYALSGDRTKTSYTDCLVLPSVNAYDLAAGESAYGRSTNRTGN